MFPKIVGFPPKSSNLIGFSILFTIHFGVSLFLDFHPTVAGKTQLIGLGLRLHYPSMVLSSVASAFQPGVAEMDYNNSMGVGAWVQKRQKMGVFGCHQKMKAVGLGVEDFLIYIYKPYIHFSGHVRVFLELPIWGDMTFCLAKVFRMKGLFFLRVPVYVPPNKTNMEAEHEGFQIRNLLFQQVPAVSFFFGGMDRSQLY